MQNLQESPQKILSTLRIDYKKDILLESRVDPSPLNQFVNWFNEAKSTKEIREANAMVISTCLNNIPSSRVVLLKNFDEEGYVFFTNYESQKSKELNENANIACLFYWDAQERAVRIEGKVEKLSEKENQQYFSTRPRDAQIGAWASLQSQVIKDREILDERFKEFQKRFEGGDVPKPEHWGGWKVKPLRYEFWQGGSNRLHDRIAYSRESLEEKEFTIVRLAP